MENVDFIIHSDTIYSALTHASLVFGEPIGDISLSSAFPFVGDLPFPKAHASVCIGCTRRELFG